MDSLLTLVGIILLGCVYAFFILVFVWMGIVFFWNWKSAPYPWRPRN